MLHHHLKRFRIHHLLIQILKNNQPWLEIILVCELWKISIFGFLFHLWWAELQWWCWAIRFSNILKWRKHWLEGSPTNKINDAKDAIVTSPLIIISTIKLSIPKAHSYPNFPPNQKVPHQCQRLPSPLHNEMHDQHSKRLQNITSSKVPKPICKMQWNLPYYNYVSFQFDHMFLRDNVQ